MSGTVSILPPAETQFCDANGAPLAGGSVATFVPGTTTPSTTWQDSAGTVPNENPLTLDAAGRAIIWGSGAYRMVVRDVSGNLIFDQVTAPSTPTGLSSLAVSGALTVGGATSLTTLAVSGAATMDTIAISQTGGGATAQPSEVSLTRTGSLATDAPLFQISATLTNANASPALNVSQSKTTITGPAAGLWANYDTVNFQGPNTVSSAGASYVTRYVESVVTNPMGGGANSPQAWALIAATIDKTNLPSAQAGLLRGMEIDLEASGVDDHTSPPGGRVILTLVGFPGRSYGGTDTQISSGLDINQQGGSSSKFSFKRMINMGGTYTIAALDLSSVVPVSDAPAILMAALTRLAVDTGGTNYIESDGIHAKLYGLWESASSFKFDGNVGFYGTPPQLQPTITGSRGGNVALASLLGNLATLGLIIDGTTT